MVRWPFLLLFLVLTRWLHSAGRLTGGSVQLWLPGPLGSHSHCIVWGPPPSSHTLSTWSLLRAFPTGQPWLISRHLKGFQEGKIGDCQGVFAASLLPRSCAESRSQAQPEFKRDYSGTLKNVVQRGTPMQQSKTTHLPLCLVHHEGHKC